MKLLDFAGKRPGVTDISETVRSGRQISESRLESDEVATGLGEQTWLAMLDASPDVHVVLDDAGRILFVSSRCEQLLGYRPSDLIGQSVDFLGAQTIPQSSATTWRDSLATPIKRSFEHPGNPLLAAHRNGALVNVTAATAPIRTERGILIMLTLRDAASAPASTPASPPDNKTASRELSTEVVLEAQVRKLATAEASARRATQRLANIADSLPEIVLQFGWKERTPRITYLSRQSESMLGIAPAAAMEDPRLLWEAIVEVDRQSVLDDLQLAAETSRSTWAREFRAIDRHGEIRWFKGAAALDVSDGGQPCWIGYWTDITEQKKQDDALRQTLAQLQVLLQTTPTAIALLRENTIVSCNPAMESAFGYREGELLGLTTRVLFDSVEQYRGTMERVSTDFGAERKTLLQVTLKRKDGTPVTMVLAGGLIDAFSKMAVWSLTDVSAQQKLTEELESAKALAEEANRAKSAFLATMSHEIRTPMHGMLGMLELLSETALDRNQHESVGLVRQSAASLLHIINEILDLSKIESGRMELRPAAMSIRKLGNDLVAIHGAVASRKNLDISVEVDERLAAIHIADEGRLQQVLNNLLSNAVKFTERGGIRLRITRLERLERAESVQFSVEDTGIGFREEDRARMFAPFVQLQHASSRGGTGLGLTISRQLVEAMGGSIAAQGRPGRGTTMSFLLTLPITVATPAQAPMECAPDRSDVDAAAGKVEESRGSTRAATILAVDDHPINLRIIARQLAALGYRVRTAANGAEAIQDWLTGGIDLILTDCHMPDMDGYALSREIRRLESASGLSPIPIVACSADALTAEPLAAREAGMNDYVVKPVGLDVLRRKLSEWIPGNASQPTATAGLARPANK